jgi:putative toxin-antitoxin system antitoxin component (TIGR02293 family)
MPVRPKRLVTRAAPDVATYTAGSARPGPPLAAGEYMVLLGLAAAPPLEVATLVAAGLPWSAVERLQANTGLPLAALAPLIDTPVRTLMRRRLAGILQPAESDRVVRVARVFARALDLHRGDRDAARAWLLAPAIAFGGQPPATVARTEVGAREVENLVGRLEQGIPS